MKIVYFRYEAYLKAMIGTGFRMPKKNILLSVGSYKHKVRTFATLELVDSIFFFGLISR